MKSLRFILKELGYFILNICYGVCCLIYRGLIIGFGIMLGFYFTIISLLLLFDNNKNGFKELLKQIFIFFRIVR